jgi:hypothetical protein
MVELIESIAGVVWFVASVYAVVVVTRRKRK